MAGNQHEGIGDDFFEQILAAGVPEQQTVGSLPMGGSDGNMMRLSMGMGMMHPPPHPLGLNLEQVGFLRHERFRNDDVDVNNHNNSNTTSHLRNTSAASPSSANSGINEREGMSVHMSNLFPAFGHLQSQQQLRPQVQPPPPHVAGSHSALTQLQQPFHNQGTPAAVNPAPQPPGVRPRVRARRGQATDPHSIAERQRRERIAERMKALQELVPSCNKTDRAAMLDEIVDYVKFLRLQVKVLSMSRLGGASAVAQLVADVPISTVEGEGNGFRVDQPWEKWSDDGTEQQVAKLMEEDIGAAMQFLQSKALCIMPVSLASAIFQTPQPDASSVVKPESNTRS